jgi:succinate dehydrogenase / fumarate reductase flavoprotein subunit
MGGLWVDYNLMSNIPGLFVGGEANFSDHGANRLGASALMQGLADGYFILPYSIGNYIGGEKISAVTTEHEAFKSAMSDVKGRIEKLTGIKGKTSADAIHRRLGKVMWDDCGMSRNEEGLKRGGTEIKKIRDQFWQDLSLPGDANSLNSELERAGRVADFLELGELMCLDALERRESCGAHFREEMQTSENEALRDDDKFCYVAAWEYQGEGKAPKLHKEPLEFEKVHLAQRNYK